MAITQVVTSPLLRAVQTATPIASITATRIEVDRCFIDRDYGPWTGHLRADLESRFTNLDQVPEIESRDALTHRVVLAALGLLTAEGTTTMVVAHDAVNRAILAALCHNTPPDPSAIPQRTGCWNRIERDEQDIAATVIDACPGDTQAP